MKKAAVLAVVGLWSVCNPNARAQGTLAHVAFGGGWQTTITLLNLTPRAAAAQVTLYADDGALLVVSPEGKSPGSQFSVEVPAGGSASLVLPNAGTQTTGWARVDTLNGIVIRGQAVFLYKPESGNSWLGAVPLATSAAAMSSGCVVPLPLPTTGTILLPFDETAGQATGLAIANVTDKEQSIAIEIDDENNAVLQTDTLNLGPLSHNAFTLGSRYPGLLNRKGIVRIGATIHVVSVLALLANAGGLTTLLPIY